jgi:hypothetical protein
MKSEEAVIGFCEKMRLVAMTILIVHCPQFHRLDRHCQAPRENRCLGSARRSHSDNLHAISCLFRR